MQASDELREAEVALSTGSAELCTDIGVVTHRGKNSKIY